VEQHTAVSAQQVILCHRCLFCPVCNVLMLLYVRCVYHCNFGMLTLVHAVGQVIVKAAEDQSTRSTEEDLILVPAAVRQINIEAVNTATDDTVCAQCC